MRRPNEIRKLECADAAADEGTGQKGAALMVTILVLALVGVLALGLMLQAQTEKVVAVNERDSLKALAAAESGLQWARRRIVDAANLSMNPTFLDYSALLGGPNAGSTADDNLIGLRDLSLVSTTAFTTANENTASAIVTRNFGDGSKTYEALRVVNGTERALIYVRIDDNYDEGTGANAPLSDKDVTISATVVAEFPVVVDGTGVQLATLAARGVAVRKLTASFGRSTNSPAVLSGGAMTLASGTLCGDCGSAIANGNVTTTCASTTTCGNITSAGTLSPGSCASVSGDYLGSQPAVPIPVINPYDNLYVPSPTLFNTTSEPEFNATYAALRCPGSGAGVVNPSAKYFAIVPGGTGAPGGSANMGRVLKAYWKSTSPTRWEWRYIDDLGDGNNTILDDCGRVVSGSVNGVVLAADAGAGAGVTDAGNDSFYGYGLTGSSAGTWTACAADTTLCAACNIANNDFNRASYYDTTSTLQTLTVAAQTVVLPGSYDPDGVRDYDGARFLSAPAWSDIGTTAYSPMYNGVVFFVGRLSPQAGLGANFTMSSSTLAPPNNIVRTSLILYRSF